MLEDSRHVFHGRCHINMLIFLKLLMAHNAGLNSNKYIKSTTLIQGKQYILHTNNSLVLKTLIYIEVCQHVMLGGFYHYVRF